MQKLDARDIAFISGVLLTAVGAFLTAPALVIVLVGCLVMYFSLNLVEDIPVSASLQPSTDDLEVGE